MKTKNNQKKQISLLLLSFLMITLNVFSSNTINKKFTDASLFANVQSIPSCSSQMVTFTAYIDLNIPANHFTYIFNVGPGWSSSGLIYTTSNLLMLTPSSPISSLGTISCTIIYTNNNGNQSQFNTNSVTVSRSTFTSNASISGSTNSCLNSNLYNLSGLLNGENVTWSLSDTNIASLTNPTNTQVTVTPINSGSVDLIATISNSCNQTTSKIFKIHFGVPTLNYFSCYSRGRDFCSGNVNIESNTLPIIDLNDKITAHFSGLTSAESGIISNWEWQVIDPIITISGNLNQKRIGILNYGDTGVRVRAKNSCGWSEWFELYFTITELPQLYSRISNETNPKYSVFPNPVNDYLFIDLKDEINTFNNKTIIKVEFYDMYYNIHKLDINFRDNKAIVDVRNLKKGIYILKISTNEKTENHRIIVR